MGDSGSKPPAPSGTRALGAERDPRATVAPARRATDTQCTECCVVEIDCTRHVRSATSRIEDDFVNLCLQGAVSSQRYYWHRQNRKAHCSGLIACNRSCIAGRNDGVNVGSIGMGGPLSDCARLRAPMNEDRWRKDGMRQNDEAVPDRDEHCDGNADGSWIGIPNPVWAPPASKESRHQARRWRAAQQA